MNPKTIMAKPDAPGLERVFLKRDSSWLPAAGKSIKPGNLMFNLGKLFESAVSGAGAYFTATTNPIFAIFVGIVAVHSLVGAATVELKEEDAWVLWATWLCERQGEATDSESVRKRLLEEGHRYGKQVNMSIEEIEKRLTHLASVHAVRPIDGEWEIIESVGVST